MGYTKYREDIKERFYEDTQALYDARQKPYTPPPKYVCPYCNCVKYLKEELFSHIKENHNIKHPVVIINDKVINTEECYVHKIEKVQIYIYGFSDTISIDGVKVNINSDESVDITSQAKETFDNNENITISVGTFAIKVMKFTMKAVRNDIINPIIKRWENSVEEGRMISFKIPSELNSVEEEYLKGFYNYFLACLSSGTEKTERYYDADSILSSFYSINTRAVCVLKVIAFKFNWVKKLEKLCEITNDEFNQIVKFYNNEELDEIKAIIIEEDDSLFIEDDLRDYMDAVENYLFGEFEIAEEYFKKISIIDIEDKNFKDRILLLAAKTYAKQNRTREANRLYSNILCEEFKKKI